VMKRVPINTILCHYNPKELQKSVILKIKTKVNLVTLRMGGELRTFLWHIIKTFTGSQEMFSDVCAPQFNISTVHEHCGYVPEVL
jgi:hypothetical protein